MDHAAAQRRARTGPNDTGGDPSQVVVRAFLAAGILLVALGTARFGRGDATPMFTTIPYDQTINMVAAQRLVDRAPLYDADASRAMAVDRAGPAMADTYTVATNGFPGLPSTALLHVPFLLGSDDAGYAAFRWASILGMLGAIALVASTLPRGARSAGGAFGTGVLLVSVAFLETINFGQGHGFVMLGFAVAIWGAATDRWRAVGIGLGVATALKLSPFLIVLYLVVRGRKQVLPWAVGTVAALAAAAAVVGRPGDLWTWATEVAPSLSGGAIQLLNQSVPALAARMASGSSDLTSTAGIGAWRHLAVFVLLIGVAALWRTRRHRPIDPLEIGVLLLLGLVAGPLTWSHYATWAVLPMVLLADPRRWTGRPPVEVGVLATTIAAAVLLLTTVAGRPTAAAVDADAALRVTTSPTTVALLLLLVACSRLVGTEVRAVSASDVAAARDDAAIEPALTASVG
ncbi:MAG: glycosyltransferase family 87 protein [Aquihabitans sp.]